MLLLLACGPAPSIRAVEIFDVPAPPGHRTLQLHGASPDGRKLGEILQLTDASGGVLGTGDLVDHAVRPPSLTVYVPEAFADRLLDATAILVAPSPVTP